MIETLLNRLDKVRKTGPDRWQARCPSHEDSDPSLSVSVIPDGRIMVHCHAGCDPVSVLAAVGLSMSDLFPDGAVNGHLRGATPWLRRQQIAEQNSIENERLILDMAEADRKAGKMLSTKDLKREREAFLRVREAQKCVDANAEG